MQNDQLKRYIWLLDIVYSQGPITKEDIDLVWAESVLNKEHQPVIPRESFNRYREAIYKIFNIRIECNRSTHAYFIDNTRDTDNTRQWLVSTILLTNAVRDSANLASRIDFESVPYGSRFLPTLINAMMEQTEVQYTYQNFHRTEPNTIHLQPYGIKLFRRRWYVHGFSIEHNEERTFALDRALSIRSTNHTWTLPYGFNIHEMFDSYYGIYRDVPPETIRIRADHKTADFIRSLPLHASQQEIERQNEYSIFQYSIAPTLEFIQELRTYANGVRVLSPQSLVDRMREDLQKTLDLYND